MLARTLMDLLPPKESEFKCSDVGLRELIAPSLVRSGNSKPRKCTAFLYSNSIRTKSGPWHACMRVCLAAAAATEHAATQQSQFLSRKS